MGMPKYDRLLYILNLLRSRKSLNAARLAEECGVTERSIYRDILSLSEANIPIYYDNGYKLASDNFLPPLNFTVEEYSFLRLALESSPLRKVADNDELAKQILAKVDAGLSEVTKEQKRTLADTTYVVEDPVLPTRDRLKFFGDLQRGIDERTRLAMEYESVAHGVTAREVDPYFLVFRNQTFYFVGMCHRSDEVRTFRVDRIRKLESTGKRFRKMSDVRPETYFTDSWRVFTGEPVEVKARFWGLAAKIVRLGTHHANEEVREIEADTVEYTVTVAGTEEIIRWLLGFGEEVEVLEPVNLRREVHRRGSALKRNHS